MIQSSYNVDTSWLTLRLVVTWFLRIVSDAAGAKLSCFLCKCWWTCYKLHL